MSVHPPPEDGDIAQRSHTRCVAGLRFGVTMIALSRSRLTPIRNRACRSSGRPARILYFGDRDASGRQISNNLESELRRHSADVTVERVALNPDQIGAWRLPTRPGKRSDTRHAAFVERFGDASVELDSVPPDTLTDLVATAIAASIDTEAWMRMQVVERAERQTLADLVAMNGGEAA